MSTFTITVTGAPPQAVKVAVIPEHFPSDIWVLPFAPEETANQGIGLDWQPIDRPGRAPLVRSAGELLHQWSGVCTIGYKDNRSIEPDLGTFRRFRRSYERFRITYGPSEQGWWRLASSSNWRTTMRLPSGDACRAVLTLDLIRASDAEIVTTPANVSSSKELSASPVSAPPSPEYVAKAGDTLVGIAATKLGDGRRWLELAALNNLTDARIKPGQRLKLPR